ncbi:hypothetical protein [Thalassotalea litorea]|uniref:hypothetical protein n=1 Tax=Thalassotalea litorea TaxID=2020715 RepID=UPI0037356BCB
MRKTHWVDNVSFYETLVKAKKLASCRDTTRHLRLEPNVSDVPIRAVRIASDTPETRRKTSLRVR